VSYPSLDGTRVVNPVLTNIAHGFRQPEFVGSLAFPPVFVKKRKGKIIRFNEDELILHEMRRAPGANTMRLMGGWGSDDYEVFQDAIEEKLPIEHLEEASDLPINMQKRSVMKAQRRIALRLEFDQLFLLGTNANYPLANRITLSGTSQWSDKANADLEAQTDVAHNAVLDGCGLMANTAIFSLKAYQSARRWVREKFYRNVKVDQIGLGEVLAAFNLSRGGIVAAKYKLPNAIAKSTMFDNKAWIGYVPNNGAPQGSMMPSADSSVDTPSFGYTYTLEGYPMAETPYYERNPKSWMFPVTAERQPLLTGMGAGYLWENVSV
jgi:hypothetical protein